MAKKKVKKSTKAKKTSSKKGLKDSGIKTAREKMIGQHIGYRYDVNLLPDYKKLTPFLKKYIDFWTDRSYIVVYDNWST